MVSKRKDSIISSTSVATGSDYSQRTEDEQDDDDAPTIGNAQDPHVATPDMYSEASAMPSEKAQSSPGSEVDTEKSVSVKLAEMKTKVTNLFDEAEKALSEASLPDEDLQYRLECTKDERDYYRKRKDEYKEYKLLLEKETQKYRDDLAALRDQLAVSQQEVAKLRKARIEMIEMGRKLFVT